MALLNHFYSFIIKNGYEHKLKKTHIIVKPIDSSVSSLQNLKVYLIMVVMGNKKSTYAVNYQPEKNKTLYTL